jgi:hypothetical protein
MLPAVLFVWLVLIPTVVLAMCRVAARRRERAASVTVDGPRLRVPAAVAPALPLRPRRPGCDASAPPGRPTGRAGAERTAPS